MQTKWLVCDALLYFVQNRTVFVPHGIPILGSNGKLISVSEINNFVFIHKISI
jgi:hypothetical protein